MIDDPNRDKVYLVFDVLEGGTIEDRILKSRKGLKPELVRRWAR